MFYFALVIGVCIRVISLKLCVPIIVLSSVLIPSTQTRPFLNQEQIDENSKYVLSVASYWKTLTVCSKNNTLGEKERRDRMWAWPTLPKNYGDLSQNLPFNILHNMHVMNMISIFFYLQTIYYFMRGLTIESCLQYRLVFTNNKNCAVR